MNGRRNQQEPLPTLRGLRECHRSPEIHLPHREQTTANAIPNEHAADSEDDDDAHDRAEQELRDDVVHPLADEQETADKRPD
jgi:hypothetical protein